MFNLPGENIKIIELLLFTMLEPFLIQKKTKFTARLRHKMKFLKILLNFLKPFSTNKNQNFSTQFKTMKVKSSNRLDL